MKNDDSQSRSRMFKNEPSCDNLREPATTLHDEDILYPYFSNPSHIRSMRSLLYHSSPGNSVVTANLSQVSSNQKHVEVNMKGVGNLISKSSIQKSKTLQMHPQIYDNTDAFISLGEISPRSQCSEAGDVSFESKGIEQDFD